jgi:hypothetical protein
MFTEYQQEQRELIDRHKKNIDEILLSSGEDEKDSFIKDLAKELKKDYEGNEELIKYIDELVPPSKRVYSFPPKWLRELNTKGQLTKVFIVMGYIFNKKHYERRLNGEALIKKYCKENTYYFDEKNQKKYRYVVFHCKDYENMCNELGKRGLHIKEQELKRYILRLKGGEIIKRIGRAGRGKDAHIIYAIGYWTPKKANFFFQKEENKVKMIEVFKNFGVVSK